MVEDICSMLSIRDALSGTSGRTYAFSLAISMIMLRLLSTRFMFLMLFMARPRAYLAPLSLMKFSLLPCDFMIWKNDTRMLW